ncbi:MAG TPA: hypothetical protein VKA94_00130, partial [Hyphomicrobiales bacterium]|nr:hypothetical protein [Hyphomicrobiales bacterium]
MVTIVKSATRTLPASYSQACDTFRAASCTARRTGYGSPSFVGFIIPGSVPTGFVAELVAEHRPTGVKHGFSHPSFGELSGIHVTNDDQGVFPRDAGRRLVNLMFARVGDLGVDRADAALVSCALLDGKRRLIFSIVAKRGNGRTVAACGQRLQAEINADLTGSSGQVVCNFALKDHVPATASIFDKASRFQARQRNIARFPKAKISLAVCDFVFRDLNITSLEWQPAERTLGAAARSKTRATPLSVPRHNELKANATYGVGVNSEKLRTARGKIYQIECCWPASIHSSFSTPLSLPLDLAAIIPHIIARSGMLLQRFAGGGVFNAIFEAENHDLFLAHSLKMSRKGNRMPDEDALVEAMARDLCKQAGHDPDEMRGGFNPEPIWKSWAPE